MLGVVASQALHVTDRDAPPPLRRFIELIRTYVPPVIEDRVLGPELERLTNAITGRIFAPHEHIDSACA